MIISELMLENFRGYESVVLDKNDVGKITFLDVLIILDILFNDGKIEQ